MAWEKFERNRVNAWRYRGSLSHEKSAFVASASPRTPSPSEWNVHELSQDLIRNVLRTAFKVETVRKIQRLCFFRLHFQWFHLITGQVCIASDFASLDGRNVHGGLGDLLLRKLTSTIYSSSSVQQAISSIIIHFEWTTATMFA